MAATHPDGYRTGCINRPQKGCRTCKERGKRYCDDARPSCQNCLRAGFECSNHEYIQCLLYKLSLRRLKGVPPVPSWPQRLGSAPVSNNALEKISTHMNINRRDGVAASSTCNLLQLPPELRIRIYGYLWEDRCIEVKIDIVQLPDDIDTIGLLGRRSVDLLSTCKQLHSEASAVLYQQTKFDFQIDNVSPLRFRTLDRHRLPFSRIKKASIQIPLNPYSENALSTVATSRLAAELRYCRGLKQLDISVFAYKWILSLSGPYPGVKAKQHANFKPSKHLRRFRVFGLRRSKRSLTFCVHTTEVSGWEGSQSISKRMLANISYRLQANDGIGSLPATSKLIMLPLWLLGIETDVPHSR